MGQYSHHLQTSKHRPRVKGLGCSVPVGPRPPRVLVKSLLPSVSPVDCRLLTQTASRAVDVARTVFTSPAAQKPLEMESLLRAGFKGKFIICTCSVLKTLEEIFDM